MNRTGITLVCIAGMVAVVAASLLVQHAIVRPNPRIAVVDLAQVVRKHQERAVAMLADASADPTSRQAAHASASEFGKRLDREVVALSQECGCVLLMREAVVSGDVEDLTPSLLARLAKQ